MPVQLTAIRDKTTKAKYCSRSHVGASVSLAIVGVLLVIKLGTVGLSNRVKKPNWSQGITGSV